MAALGCEEVRNLGTPVDLFARQPGQNSPCTHARLPEPGQNSPSTHARLPEPGQNSPCTAKIAHFEPFSVLRAKIVTIKAQTPQAGRLFLAVGWSNRSWATCVAPPAAGFSQGAQPPHRDHLLGPRKARSGTHTAFMSTMSHGDWDALKEISPLLGIAPVGMKYKSPLLA